MIPSTEAAAPNRLARERSTYLRQHAHNPVDWRPWGEEALALARALDKPILLSIGYSACHWCHVMAHESFEDPDVARLMNEWFVCIKVDREERPDLDQLYQGVVQLIGRGGGWPLTVFLTPELRPFFGGTYFPREDRYGVIGFARLLRALHDAWVDRRAEVEAQSQDFATGLDHLAGLGLESAPRALQKSDLVAASRLLAREVDRRNGGFGGAPKFPSPMNVELLLRGHRRGGGPELLSSAQLTLERMARGGVYDQLGGGFHRYSVDAAWRVPHFEKMLYDNAQLLHLYSEAQQLGPRPLWRKVASETVEYVRREMTSPEGGFFASQDADSEGEEGRFFVWTPEELDRALPAELSRVAKLHFGVEPGGNFEGGASVLQVQRDAAELAEELGKSEAEVEAMLASARAALWREREKRPKPGRDEKILAGWNGLMLRGLALASRAFGEPGWALLASRAADFVTRSLWDGRTLLRLYQGGPGEGAGLSEDYGALASGLLALFQATFEPRWLELASALVRRAGELFWDERAGAYLSAARDQRDLVARQYALHDGAAPSGGSSLAEAQLALAALTGDPDHLARAGRYLERMADPMAENPFGFGHLWLAADAYLDGAPELALVGDAKGRAALADVLDRSYAPTVALLSVESADGAPPILSRALEGRGPIGGRAAAYLCRSFSCDRPVTSPEQLEARLRALAG